MLATVGGTVGAIGLYVLIQIQKPWLLRHAWMAGVASVGLAAGTLALTSVDAGMRGRHMGVFSSALAVASSLIGWCTPRFSQFETPRP